MTKPDFGYLPLPGTITSISNATSFSVALDEMSVRLLGVTHSIVQVWQDQTPGRAVINFVLLPGIDDCNFRAAFSWKAFTLEELVELMQNWLERTNYKYVNVHALEDYCKYIGAYDIDWS